MNLNDPAEWLKHHGKVATQAYITNSGQYCLTWKAHGGFIISGYGKIEVELNDNLYNNIKNELFEWCVVCDEWKDTKNNAGS